MKINILYFGMIAETVNKSSEIMEFDSDFVTIEQLKNRLENSYSKMSQLTYKLALNQKLVQDNQRLTNNDEIAVLPPFAGG